MGSRWIESLESMIMGKRGPPPTPSAVLRLSGSWRGKLNRNEPQPRRRRPPCPRWLDAYARAAWRSLVPQLDEMGVLTNIDGHALAVLCETWSRWRHAVEFVRDNGNTYDVPDANGNVRHLKRPESTIVDVTARSLNRYFTEFGLTPSARTRIQVEPKTAPDGKDAKAGYVNVG